MKTIKFTVPGFPVATARAGRRFNPVTKKSNSFTPKKTRIFQNLVRLAFTQAFPGFFPMGGPIYMKVDAFMAITGSIPKRAQDLARQDETAVPHIKKPDGKNIRWGIEDALEGVAFLNDSQVSKYVDNKTYSPRPRIEVQIWYYEDASAEPWLPARKAKKEKPECQKTKNPELF
jgi:Holliday junction resolvase RusA-like endonuclease